MTPEQIVEKIKKAGLELPARFIIDSNVPVFNLLHNVFHCMSPLISPLVSMFGSTSGVNHFFEMIKDEKQRELILDLLYSEDVR